MKITSYHELIQNIYDLSTEDKRRILDLLERNLIEEKREEIHTNYLQSMKEVKSGKIKFISSIEELKKSI